MQKENLKFFVLFVLIILQLIFATDIVYGQCGPTGKENCDTKPKTIRKKISEKKIVPNVDSPVKSSKSVQSATIASPAKTGNSTFRSRIKRGPSTGVERYIEYAAQNCEDKDCQIKYYTKAIEINPNSATAFYFRGSTYFYKENYDQAIEDFNRAIELEPKHERAFYGRGLVYFSKGNYDQAIVDFNKAIELDPYFAYAYHRRGLSNHNKGNYDQAIRDFTEAMQIPVARTHEEFIYSRGLSYQSKGNYHQAIEDFTKSIESFLHYRSYELTPEKYNNRGYSYTKIGDFNKAIVDYTKAIELDPTNAEAYNLRSQAHQALGNKNLAEADMRRYQELKR